MKKNQIGATIIRRTANANLIVLNKVFAKILIFQPPTGASMKGWQVFKRYS